MAHHLSAMLLASASLSVVVAQSPPRRLLPDFLSHITMEKPVVSSGSSFTADQPVSARSMIGAMPSLPSTLLEPSSPNMEGLTDESNQIVQGMVEAFFHKESLQKGEEECLSKGAGQIAADMATMSSNLMTALHQAMGDQPHTSLRHRQSSKASVGDEADDISAKVDAMMSGGGEEEQVDEWGIPTDVVGSASASPATAAPEERQTASEGQHDLDFFYGGRRLGLGLPAQMMSVAPGLVMQMGGAAQNMVKLSQQLMKDCLHQDALEALDLAASHMKRMDYVSGRILANGQDLVQELAQALESYKEKNYRQFGSDMGTAMRKVFLSQNAGNKLPEGMPHEEVVYNVTQGVLKGFFGKGTELNIQLGGDKDHVPAEIPIDLHACIGDNLGFFQSIWAELMFIYAKKSAGTTDPSVKEDTMQFSTAVAFTMMGLPKALKKCNMGEEEKELLTDAVRGLATGSEEVHMDFKMPPEGRVSKDKMERHMAIAAEDWAKMRWTTFGEDVGKLLQEIALTVTESRDTKHNPDAIQRYELPSSLKHSNSPVATYLSLGLGCAAAVAGLSLVVLRRAGLGLRGDEEDLEVFIFADEAAE